MTKIWEESKDVEIRIIVMNHSTPIYEVKPIYKKELIINNDQKSNDDWTMEDIYKVNESSLDFWEEDDEAAKLFDTSISL